MSKFYRFCELCGDSAIKSKILAIISSKYNIKPEINVTNMFGILVVDLLLTTPLDYKNTISSLMRDLSSFLCRDLYVSSSVLDYTNTEIICSVQISTEKLSK